jgi:hypothetical protein
VICRDKIAGMAKQLETNPITAADLSEYLRTQDDFAFELEILQLCLRGAFAVEHGGTYQDLVTAKDRQFDIRMVDFRENFVIRLAIECKNLKTNFPLLVSCVPRRTQESFHDIVISRRSLPGNPVMGTGVRTVRAEGSDTIFKADKLVGKSTAQVGKAKGELVISDAEVYEKWSQALGSAFDLVLSSARDYETTGTNAAATVILPLLVVPDSTLWTVDYSVEGKQQGDPKPSTSCELFIGKTIDTGLRYAVSHLLIFTKTKFDGLLDRIATNDKYWKSIFFSSLVLDKLS